MVEPSILPLRLVGARVMRRGKCLVGPIDLELGPGRATVVIGPNGAGKTSLLRMMHGMERIASGGATWAVDEETARTRQAFVFQTPVMMRRSALENVAYPLLVHGMSRATAHSRAAKWLVRVGLDGAADKLATVLSGGERQKLALARALIRDPQVLFLDEPCASLDGRSMREIEDILQQALAAGTRIVMATHDMGQARRLAGNVVFIHRGKILETAPAEIFFDGPQTREAQAFLRGDIVE